MHNQCMTPTWYRPHFTLWCKLDPLKYTACNRIDKSTYNCVCHVNTCTPLTSSASVPSFSTYNVGKFRYLVAAWSVHHVRPHLITEDEELREILIMLNSLVKIHSHQTVSHDICDMYHRSCTAIALHLQSVNQHLHIALDGWSAPNLFSFLGVTVQYFENNNICGFVLDLVKYIYIPFYIQPLTYTAVIRMSGWHTGRYLAWELEALLKSFSIEKKVCLLLATFCWETYLYISWDSVNHMWQCHKQQYNDWSTWPSGFSRRWKLYPMLSPHPQLIC